MATPVHVTLLGKPGCHLCDDARAVVTSVCTDLQAQGVEIECAEKNILEDSELARLHSEDIPVVFIDGRRHAIWRVDATKLTAALVKASKKPAWLRGSRSA